MLEGPAVHPRPLEGFKPLNSSQYPSRCSANALRYPTSYSLINCINLSTSSICLGECPRPGPCRSAREGWTGGGRTSCCLAIDAGRAVTHDEMSDDEISDDLEIDAGRARQGRGRRTPSQLVSCHAGSRVSSPQAREGIELAARELASPSSWRLRGVFAASRRRRPPGSRPASPQSSLPSGGLGTLMRFVS
jgi:hypothetical protein